MIELIHVRLANLTSAAKLVRSPVVGDDIGRVPGEVTAAFRRCQTNLFKVPDHDVGSTENGLPVDSRIGAKEQAQCFRIETVVEVAESLVEVVGANEHLVGQSRCEYGIQRERIVEHVDGGVFEGALQIRAGRSQRGASAERRSLVALSPEPAERQTVFIVEVVVDLRHAVVTVADGSDGAEKIVGYCGKTGNAAASRPRPKAGRSDQSLGN